MSESAQTSSQEEKLGKAYDAKLVARLWPFVHPHRFLFAFSMLLIPVSVALELVQPYLLSLAIDIHIALHDTEGLAKVCGLFVLSVALQSAVGYVQLYTLQLVGQRSMHGLRKKLYTHVLSRRMAFFDRVPIGRLLTRMTNDVENINEMFAGGVVTLLADVFKLTAIVIMMLLLNVKLTLITFLTIPFLVLLVRWARQVMRHSFREIRVKVAAMNTHVQEHISGLPIVQLFGREPHAASEYDKHNAAHRDAYLGAIKADATMYAAVEAIGFASIALIAWYAGIRIGDGVLTVGLVVAFIEYVNKFFVPVKDLSAKYTVMQSAMAAAERVTSLLDNKEVDAPQMSSKTMGYAIPASKTGVAFRNLHFSYANKDPIINGLDLEIPQGTTVAIVGATGSGKSTLIKLITRLYEPQKGTITFNGVDTKTMSPQDLRKKITVVNQDVYLFSGTIEDNIKLGKLDATTEQVEAALTLVGASDYLKKQNRNLNTEVLERGRNFSSGEKQMISFARALVRDPEFLILDEATANIDPEAEAVIEKGLNSLTKGRTNLIIAHRLSTIKRADTIIVLDKGQIVESGSRQELLAIGGHYTKLEHSFGKNPSQPSLS